MAATARLGKNYDVVLSEDPSSRADNRNKARQGNCLTRRTFLEKVLIAVAVLAILVIILLVIIILGVFVSRPETPDEIENVCHSKPCIIAAADLLNSMNTSLSPCEDFYDYACQTWVERETLFEQSADKFSHLASDLQVKLKETLEDDYDELPEHFRKIIFAHKRCLNIEARERTSLTPLLNDVTKFGGFPALLGDKWAHSGFDYLDVLNRMIARGFGTNYLFGVAPVQDFKDSSREIIAVSQMKQGMTSMDWFETNYIINLYANYTSQNAKMLCKEMENCTATPQEIDKEIREAVMLEKEFVSFMFPEEITSDKKKLYHVMKIKELEKIAQEVDWLRLFHIFLPKASISDETEIMVMLPDFMTNMSKLLGELTSTLAGRRTLINYMFYRQMNEASKYLTVGMKRNFHDFEGRVTGERTVPDLWKDCVDFIMKNFDFSLASKYVRKYSSPGRRKAIQDLVQNLKNELVSILEETEWMDKETKDAAIRKVHIIYVMPGYPENLLDDAVQNKYYESLMIYPSHYENFASALIFDHEKGNEDFGKPIDRANWKFFPGSILDTNAFFFGTNNTIFVPLGVAQDWFFEDRGPSYVNYGRMAFLLGHELSHAFDITGAEEDEHGNLKNWWQNKTFEQFLKNSACMVQMFDGYVDKQVNMSVKGESTVKENIADDAGVTEAYGAFKKTLETNPSLSLPGLDLTVNQLFWVNYASIWCLKNGMEAAELSITSDEHAPARFRVNSPLSNSYDFLTDFKCKPGDGMYRSPPHCHVWGALSGTQ